MLRRATVKIAPLEHWCPEARRTEIPQLVGLPITILPATRQHWNDPQASWYKPHLCSGAYYDVAKESAEELFALLGIFSEPGATSVTGTPVICEHLLEMD